MNTAETTTSSLKIKTLLGFVELIVILGLFLFAPAGSLNFWQAWVYSIIYVASSVTITFYLWRTNPELLARRVNAGPGAEKEKTQKITHFFVILLFIAILVISAFDHRFGWSHVPFYIVILGDILVILGFFLLFLVFRENAFASAIIEVTADQKVITTGPYSIVRHPLYVSGLIIMLGTPLALGSWCSLLVFIPLTLVIIWRLIDEEKFLSKNLPGYEEYCQKVRYRLIPFLW
ncbi:isoprenylcysteine carboxylmethyltransferase family protein [Methanosarcina sp.]|uniref:methyltransferase family protein n=1 Tax=Methanosarcina sp. TaxID=2213 RepID=UPI0029899E71|nr:isoprenylcysteine carboxylmethyltransferase family protein [Methanosarcina sp.]MDW5552159.1 isoprenylcysteine carboxylmethyltransferase family protein [Methanosarcina sp.]MDW5555890.1 isoprenylcysteine carboxylmethyltransferase family protein [Methanosarcina sp.]MDW5560117.1 isoprenylcysteine carboxylmethyltransferase family protein [Methanosarcina sp.]